MEPEGSDLDRPEDPQLEPQVEHRKKGMLSPGFVLIGSLVLAVIAWGVVLVPFGNDGLAGNNAHHLDWMSASIAIGLSALAVLCAALYWRSSRVFDRRRHWRAPKD